VEADVPPVTFTVAGRFPKEQVNVPFEIEHPDVVVVHAMPAGSVSVRVGELAVPAPELLTTTVYPIDAPALTVPCSGVSVIPSVGHCTVMLALADTVPAFDALADA
jgi:hypothetical protein